MSPFLLGACYSHRPLSSASPAIGSRITAQLTDAGSERLLGTIGPAARYVEGDIARADDATLTLYVVRVERRGGAWDLWNRETVTFTRDALTDIQEKHLDRTRSWLLAGAIAASAFLAARGFGAFDTSDTGGSTTPPAQ
jgi:hypothetical protein